MMRSHLKAEPSIRDAQVAKLSTKASQDLTRRRCSRLDHPAASENRAVSMAWHSDPPRPTAYQTCTVNTIVYRLGCLWDCCFCVLLHLLLASRLCCCQDHAELARVHDSKAVRAVNQHLLVVPGCLSTLKGKRHDFKI